MSNGLLDLRKAKAFAATFDPTWDERSSDTFLRWLKKLDQLKKPREKKLLVRFAAGRTAPYWVRKEILTSALDVNDICVNAQLRALQDRVTEIENDIGQLGRRVSGFGLDRF